MNASVSAAEAELIAMKAAQAVHDRIAEQLPAMMKPILYEVAEAVTQKQKDMFAEMLRRVFLTDMANEDRVRDLQKDLMHLRDIRTNREGDRKQVRTVIIDTILKTVLSIFGIGATIWLAQQLGLIVVPVIDK